MTDPVAAITALVQTVQKVRELTKRLEDVEVQEVLVEIQEQCLALQKEIVTLRAENQRLRDTGDRRERLEFSDNVYWLYGEGPYCNRCFDVEKHLVRMTTKPMYWTCPQCETAIKRPGIPPQRRRTQWTR